MRGSCCGGVISFISGFSPLNFQPHLYPHEQYFGCKELTECIIPIISSNTSQFSYCPEIWKMCPQGDQLPVMLWAEGREAGSTEWSIKGSKTFCLGRFSMIHFWSQCRKWTEGLCFVIGCHVHDQTHSETCHTMYAYLICSVWGLQ